MSSSPGNDWGDCLGASMALPGSRRRPMAAPARYGKPCITARSRDLTRSLIADSGSAGEIAQAPKPGSESRPRRCCLSHRAVESMFNSAHTMLWCSKLSFPANARPVRSVAICHWGTSAPRRRRRPRRALRPHLTNLPHRPSRMDTRAPAPSDPRTPSERRCPHCPCRFPIFGGTGCPTSRRPARGPGRHHEQRGCRAQRSAQ
jgi:hypothetical protein